MALKHVGRDAKTHRKVIVAYRVVPGEPDNCLIIKTESLDAASHDSLMTAVESNAGQNADEFAEAMFRTTLPDGLNMLTGMQKYGKLVKVPTASIDMTPDTKSSINLAELNALTLNNHLFSDTVNEKFYLNLKAGIAIRIIEPL